MSKLDEYEARLPIKEDWEANFDLTLAISKKGIEVRELDDVLNDALDELYRAERKVDAADAEYKQALREMKALEIQLTDRERLLRKELS